MPTQQQQEDQAHAWGLIASALEPYTWEERRRVRWVLSTETWAYLRGLFAPSPRPPIYWFPEKTPSGDPTLMLGQPIRLDDSADGIRVELVDAP